MLTDRTIVIEVSGGVVQAVYHDLPDLDVVIVDWDNIKEGGDVEMPLTASLDSMPEETEAEVEKAFA